MISLSWRSDFEPTRFDDDQAIADLMERFRGLPRHIAKKHLKAAMRRPLKRAVPILRRLTPPLDMRRGRKKKGVKPRSTGDLRRRVTTKVGQTGRNADFNSFVWAVLGYRLKGQDRKPIWLNYGTATGGPAFNMIEKAMDQFGPVAAQELAKELAAALEKATEEMASKKNPGMSRRGLAAGVRPR